MNIQSMAISLDETNTATVTCGKLKMVVICINTEYSWSNYTVTTNFGVQVAGTSSPIWDMENKTKSENLKAAVAMIKLAEAVFDANKPEPEPEVQETIEE